MLTVDYDREALQKVGDFPAFLAAKLQNDYSDAGIISQAQQYPDEMGWFDPEKWASPAQLQTLMQLAAQVKQQASVLVVVGVGGSNQAAKAVVKACQGAHPDCEIVYTGTDFSPYHYAELLADLQDKDFSIDVVAKNFQTLEPGVGFRILTALLKQKYGADYAQHVYVTGTPGDRLGQLAIQEGYHWLTFPTDIGGPYCALSDVGLFPMAVAGLDIHAVVAGAVRQKQQLAALAGEQDPVLVYAALRNFVMAKGYRIELLGFFDPRLRDFARWWRQLVSETEGKANTGLYPAYQFYSEDLHSVGQYLQEGQASVCETLLTVAQADEALVVAASGVADGFDYLTGQSLAQINRVLEDSVVQAHRLRGMPIISIGIDRLDESAFGALFYFCERAVFTSALMLGVDPFEQAGADVYKTFLYAGLGR